MKPWMVSIRPLPKLAYAPFRKKPAWHARIRRFSLCWRQPFPPCFNAIFAKDKKRARKIFRLKLKAKRRMLREESFCCASVAMGGFQCLLQQAYPTLGNAGFECLLQQAYPTLTCSLSFSFDKLQSLPGADCQGYPVELPRDFAPATGCADSLPLHEVGD